jgi:hypothetical protein
MLARVIVLIVAAGIGLVALPFLAFITGLGVMGPGGADQGRGFAVFAIVVCAGFLVWEAFELRLALRHPQRIVTPGRAVIVVVATVLTVLTTVGYVLLRIALR